MSTYTSEPGTRLAGRYRLVDQVNTGVGWAYWKAMDETLARPVAVLTFAAGFPRVLKAITAARAASRLSDPRFCQVFDVEDADELAYVVMEWVASESLLDMLAEGPLDPPRAAMLMKEAARAIATAHATGLAHLRLDPACLHWTPGGGVKIAGLGIDAALADTDPATAASGDDPELTDTRDLARLLYAALTGYWPGPQGVGGSGPGVLPPAPESDGILCTPRQVSAGVPASMDDVTCRALFQRPNRHGPAITTAAMFADVLADVTPPVPLPVPPPSPSSARTSHGGLGYTADRSADPYATAGATAQAPAGRGSRRPQAGPHSGPARAVISAVIVLVLVAVGVAVWFISRGSNNSASPPGGRQHSTSPAATAAVLLKPVSAGSFNPLGKPPGSNEDAGDTQFAIDGSPSTFWHTSYYVGDPAFGNLKKGTGLILDMGKEVRLSQVVVQFGTSCCAHVQIELGNGNVPVPSTLSTFTVLQNSDTARGSTTFNVTKNTAGRYLLIWLTYLPPLSGSQYQANIYNVTVHGFAASQSG